jgi:hypothetical protein
MWWLPLLAPSRFVKLLIKTLRSKLCTCYVCFRLRLAESNPFKNRSLICCESAPASASSPRIMPVVDPIDHSEQGSSPRLGWPRANSIPFSRFNVSTSAETSAVVLALDAPHLFAHNRRPLGLAEFSGSNSQVCKEVARLSEVVGCSPPICFMDALHPLGQTPPSGCSSG